MAEILTERYPVPIRRIGIKDCFGCSGSPEGLLKLYGLTPEDIIEAVKDITGIKKSKR